jgi:hypothetical protein
MGMRANATNGFIYGLFLCRLSNYQHGRKIGSVLFWLSAAVL